MKRIATAALALSFAANAGLALAEDGLVGRLSRQVQERVADQKPAAEQPKPAAPPPAREGRQESPRAPREAATQQAAPPVRTDEGPRRDRGDDGGRRGGNPEPTATPQVVAPPVAAPQVIRTERRGDPRNQGNESRRDGPRTRELQSQPPPPPSPVQQQSAPSRSGPLGEALDNLRREQQRDGRRGDGRRGDGDRDRDGWSRDGGRGGWDHDGRGPQQRPDWATRDGRHDRDRDRPHYDPRRYQHDWRANRRYRVPIYVIPFGYYDYSWSYDDYLPWGWYGPRYWIDDWYRYGLPPPPAGYEWVRVGRDAMLVDVFDGRIRSVVRLLFW